MRRNFSSSTNQYSRPSSSEGRRPRVVAVFLGTFVFSLGYLTARRERSPRLWSLALAVFGVLLVQIAVGEIQWRTHLPWGVVLVHVLLAATVWAGTVALATLFVRPLRSLAPNVGLTDG